MEPAEWRQPIRDGYYVDEAGLRWRLRGGEALAWKRVERLIKDPQVRVLHLYLDEVREVSPEDREGFSARIRPHLVGSNRQANDHTDIRAGEFKDGRRRSLLLVEETC